MGEAFETDSTLISTNEYNKLTQPVYILINEMTSSGAEATIITLQNILNPIIIGTPSYGSACQPLIVPLPGGGHARICSMQAYYSNGKEFNYVEPDYLVEPSIEDILNKKDIVLLKAISIIQNTR